MVRLHNYEYNACFCLVIQKKLETLHAKSTPICIGQWEILLPLKEKDGRCGKEEQQQKRTRLGDWLVPVH